jgi:hypothetical protein
LVSNLGNSGLTVSDEIILLSIEVHVGNIWRVETDTGTLVGEWTTSVSELVLILGKLSSGIEIDKVAPGEPV